MGRHSAPDEVADETVPEATSTVPGTASTVDVEALRGRHARADDGDVQGLDEAHTQRIAVIEAAPVPPMVDEHPTDVLVPWAAPVETAAPEVDEPAPQAEPAKGKKPKAAKAPKQAKPPKDKKPKAVKTPKPDKAEARAAKRTAKAERKKARSATRAETNTRADLRVLRENPAVRAQAIGAVVVSFLLYTVVMLVIGRTDVYLLWLWAPIVISGVLVGVVLDLAHRRLAKRAGDPH